MRGVIFASLFLGGCAGGTPGTDSDPTCRQTGGCGTGQPATVSLRVEMDMGVDWKVDGDPVADCQGTATCTLQLVEGTHEISADSDAFMVIPKIVDVDASSTQVLFTEDIEGGSTTAIEILRWDKFGDCGVIIEGMYLDEDDDVRTIQTEIKDGLVTIQGLAVSYIPMLGFEYYGSRDELETTGYIAEDFSTIHYEMWVDGELVGEEDLIRQ